MQARVAHINIADTHTHTNILTKIVERYDMLRHLCGRVHMWVCSKQNKESYTFNIHFIEGLCHHHHQPTVTSATATVGWHVRKQWWKLRERHPPSACCSEKERLLHSLEAFHVVYNLYGNSHMSVIMQKHSWQFLGAATEDEPVKGTGWWGRGNWGEVSQGILHFKRKKMLKKNS